jgi:hypothetical protein
MALSRQLFRETVPLSIFLNFSGHILQRACSQPFYNIPELCTAIKTVYTQRIPHARKSTLNFTFACLPLKQFFVV